MKHDPTPVEFESADGVRLRGQVQGRGPSWVVLVHDTGGDLDAYRGLAQSLVCTGFGVLSFDLRGHGLSEGFCQESRLHLDVEAALAHVARAGARERFLVAAGTGAAATLVAVGRVPVKACVLLSPRSNLMGHTGEEIRRSTAPKLFLSGSYDERVSDSVRALQGRAIGSSMLVWVPTAKQGSDLLAGVWARQVTSHAVGFLTQNRRSTPCLPSYS